MARSSRRQSFIYPRGGVLAYAERGIPSAQRLMGIVPWAGHLVHMPGHIWLVLGDYELAASVNERAGAVDREYLSATNVSSNYMGYYIHNLHFVVYARSMQGQRAATLKAAAAMEAGIAPMIQAMPEMADGFLAQVVLARVRTAAWDEVL